MTCYLCTQDVLPHFLPGSPLPVGLPTAASLAGLCLEQVSCRTEDGYSLTKSGESTQKCARCSASGIIKKKSCLLPHTAHLLFFSNPFNFFSARYGVVFFTAAIPVDSGVCGFYICISVSCALRYNGAHVSCFMFSSPSLEGER